MENESGLLVHTFTCQGLAPVQGVLLEVDRTLKSEVRNCQICPSYETRLKKNNLAISDLAVEYVKLSQLDNKRTPLNNYFQFCFNHYH